MWRRFFTATLVRMTVIRECVELGLIFSGALHCRMKCLTIFA